MGMPVTHGLHGTTNQLSLKSDGYHNQEAICISAMYNRLQSMASSRALQRQSATYMVHVCMHTHILQGGWSRGAAIAWLDYRPCGPPRPRLADGCQRDEQHASEREAQQHRQHRDILGVVIVEIIRACDAVP